MKFCKGNTQKRILKHLRDLPMSKEGYVGQKTVEEIASELGLEKDDVIVECHKLDKKDFVSWTERNSEGGGADKVTLHEKTKYMITPEGVKSIDKNWNQRILNIIFAVSAIITIIVAIKQFYP